MIEVVGSLRQAMNTKAEITLKVPLDVAEAYRKATEKERGQIAVRLSVMLRSRLTPEILGSILHDDE
jgi:hypothetical protein